MDRSIDKQNGWMNGWMDAWVDGWIDRWVDHYHLKCLRLSQLLVLNKPSVT